MKKSAVFSKCGNYRYSLFRSWDESKGLVLFIMHNPSTADKIRDDKTIKRCINFAIDWGYGGLQVGNLFAYRTKCPKELFKVRNAEGKYNRKYLNLMIKSSKLVICVWGNNQGSPPKFLQNKSDLYYLKLLSDFKTSCHPLYLDRRIKPKKF